MKGYYQRIEAYKENGQEFNCNGFIVTVGKFKRMLEHVCHFQQLNLFKPIENKRTRALLRLPLVLEKEWPLLRQYLRKVSLIIQLSTIFKQEWAMMGMQYANIWPILAMNVKDRGNLNFSENIK